MVMLMSDEIYSWYACPFIPKEGYLCSKPKGHSRKCEARFSDGGKFEFDSIGAAIDSDPCPISISKKELIAFGVEIPVGY